jgi:hypothetical protein
MREAGLRCAVEFAWQRDCAETMRLYQRLGADRMRLTG